MRPVLLSVLLASLAGCDGGGAELEAFRARPQQDCGAFSWRTDCSVDPRPFVDCLAAAADAGTSARLEWTVYSVEGDPIVSAAFTTAGDAGVTFFRDTRADAFGQKTVTKRQCAGLTVPEPCAWPQPTGCDG